MPVPAIGSGLFPLKTMRMRFFLLRGQPGLAISLISRHHTAFAHPAALRKDTHDPLGKA